MPDTGYTCIDPTDANAKINKYSTSASFGERTISIMIGYEICQKASQPNVTCWDFDKINKWAQDNGFFIDWIRPETKINVHETDFKEVGLRAMGSV